MRVGGSIKAISLNSSDPLTALWLQRVPNWVVDGGWFTPTLNGLILNVDRSDLCISFENAKKL